MSKKWFLIAGSFRSGTTLCRLCLDSHPKIHVFDEQHSYSMIDRQGWSGLVLSQPSDIEVIGFKVPVISQQFRYRMGEWTDRFGSAPKIIWMNRDVIQIVASMKATWGDASFERFKSNILSWQAESRLYPQEKETIKLIEDLPKPLQGIGYATFLAFYKQNSCDFIEDVHVVRYEKLVSQPEKTLKGVLEYLEIKWDGAVLRHHEIEHSESGVGGTNASRSIDKLSLKLWEHRLTADELSAIKSVVVEMSKG